MRCCQRRRVSAAKQQQQKAIDAGERQTELHRALFVYTATKRLTIPAMMRLERFSHHSFSPGA